MDLRVFLQNQYLLLLILGLLGSFNAAGQDGGRDAQDRFTLPTEGGKSSSIVTVGGVPVNLYTGTMSPQIPLLTLPGRRLSASVALAYGAGNGVQLTSIAGEVGTGWSLAVGGSITCEVKDKPDQLSSGDKRWINELVNRNTNPVRDIQDNQLCAEKDTELDIYHLSAPGIQADFVIHGPFGNNLNTVDVRVLNDRTLKIVPFFYYNSHEIYKFLVTDAFGTKYEFDVREIRKVKSETKNLFTNNNYPALQYEYNSTYLLSRITDIANETLYFTYDVSTAAPEVYKSASQTTTAYWGCDTNGNNGQPQSPSTASNAANTFNYETTTTITYPYRQRLSMIFSDAGTLTFSRNKVARLDAPGEYALDKITLAIHDSKVISSYKFNYSYFGSIVGNVNKADVRLKLTSISKQAQGCYNTNVAFKYKETAPVSRRGVNRDYWGYFNTNTSPCLLPSVPGESRYDCSDRTPNGTAMQNCLLERIETSAGGFTTFEFSAHQDSRYQTIGGVRLATVTVGDASNRALDQRFEISYNTFDINNPTATGSISSPVVNPPQLYDWQWYRRAGNDLCSSSDDVVNKYLYRNTEPIEPVAPDYIHYQWAAVKYPNGSRSIYKFTSAQDNADPASAAPLALKLSTNLYEKSMACYGTETFGFPPDESGWTCDGDPYAPKTRGIYTSLGNAERPYGIRTSHAYRRGLLLEQIEADANSNLVTRTQNEYGSYSTGNQLANSTPLRSAVVAKEQEIFGFGPWSYYYNIRVYELKEMWMPLLQQTATVYNQRKGGSATGSRVTYTQYVYQNFMVSRTILRDSYSSDKLDVVEYKRVKDSPSTFGPLTTAQADGVILEKNEYQNLTQNQVYGGSPLPGGFSTRYDYITNTNPTGSIVLHRTGTRDPQFISAGYRYKATSIERDAYNNPVNVTATNGINNGTIWGYGNLLPVATVANAIVSTIEYDGQQASTAGHTSFEDYGAADGWWPVQEYRENEAKTGSRSIKLHKAVSEWGTGRKFRLPPAYQHGKYTFSCWAKLPQEQTSATSFTLVCILKDGSANQNQLRWSGTTAQVNSTQQWQRYQVSVDLDDPAIRNTLPNSQDVVFQCFLWLTGTEPVLVDEIRFNSSEARMTTMTYRPLVGKTSSTDENHLTTYYDYADDNSLLFVRDEKGNIIKRTTSRLASANSTMAVSVDRTGNLYPGQQVTFTANVPTCVSNVTYYWNFGDNTAPVKGEAVQPHTYQQPGNYPLTVVAEATNVDPAEYTTLIQLASPMSIGANYTGSTSYDLCAPYGASDQSASITVLPSGGCSGAYTYKWEYREYQRQYGGGGSWSNWQDANNTSDTYSYYHSTPSQIEVQCTIRDACGNEQQYTDGFYTYYSDPMCPQVIYKQAAKSTTK